MSKKNENLIESNNSGINVTINGLQKGIEALDSFLLASVQNAYSQKGSLKVMKKDGLTENYTFNDNRACIYCGDPLADQFSKKRIYCPEERDENGKLVKDCKGSYNRMIDKPELEVHRELIKEHKTVDDMIEAMVAKKGDIVSTDDLNAYDIQLSSSLKFNLHRNGVLESYFLKYTIISNPIHNNHKIQKNG